LALKIIRKDAEKKTILKTNLCRGEKKKKYIWGRVLEVWGGEDLVRKRTRTQRVKINLERESKKKTRISIMVGL